MNETLQKYCSNCDRLFPELYLLLHHLFCRDCYIKITKREPLPVDRASPTEMFY